MIDSPESEMLRLTLFTAVSNLFLLIPQSTDTDLFISFSYLVFLSLALCYSHFLSHPAVNAFSTLVLISPRFSPLSPFFSLSLSLKGWGMFL